MNFFRNFPNLTFIRQVAAGAFDLWAARGRGRGGPTRGGRGGRGGYRPVGVL